MPENVSIPGYELLEKLGSGSAGTVYKARQISMDRAVAVKILPAALAEDERFIERFYREARAVAKLNHPNIVTGIDVGSAGGLYYFVMEYVDGEEASKRIAREGPLLEAEALDVAKQIAQALEHAFKNGIVHRDIKPANIMLTNDGIAKLADLGVARQTGGAAAAAGGRIFGTPYYMSPEQARGEADIDIRSDMYCLGATLYHLLAGKPAFHGDPPAVVMAKQIAEEPEDIREINPRVSKAAAALVAHMMAKNRDDRPEMPSDLIAEIDRVMKGHFPPGMRPSALPRREAAVRAGSLHAHAERQGAARRRGHIDGGSAEHRGAKASRSKGLVAGTVLGAIVLVAAIVLALTMGPEEDAGKPPPPVTPTAKTQPPEVGPGKGPARAKAPPKADREAGAKKALKAAMRKGLGQGERRDELRKVIAGFRGTKAAARAAEQLGRLEVQIKVARARREMEREVDGLRNKAKGLIGEGKLADAVGSVDPSRARGPLSEKLAALRREILNLGVLEIARAEMKALKDAKQGNTRGARRALSAFRVKGVKELEERAAQALAKVDEIEGEKAEAASRLALQKAEAAYAGLCEKVNAELVAFRPGEARRLLSSARTDRKMSPLRDRIREDLAHVGYFEAVVKAALRGVEMLTGQTRGLAMRDGTTETGKILRVSEEAIEVETRIKGAVGGGVVSRKLDLSRLSDREISKLALIALDNDSGETFLKLAVLYAAGGNPRLAERRLEKARELGAGAGAIASVERRWIRGASDELAAAKLLKEARAHFKAKRYAECRKLLLKLRDEYSHTEAYKRNYPAPPGGKKRNESGSQSGGNPGYVVREYWKGIAGSAVKDFTQSPAFAGKPSGTDRLSSLEAKKGVGQNYGARIRGFVIPPTDGRYVFWIHSDDASELWLSTDSSPKNRRKIALCRTYVSEAQWNRLDGQKSESTALKGGHRYYIEVLYKNGIGWDTFAVGWRLPDGTLERPIPGKRLAPPE